LLKCLIFSYKYGKRSNVNFKNGKLKGEIIMASVYSAGDFRNGTTFEMEGNVYRIVEFQHVKPGKGSAFVRTKLKNVITGATLEKTFNPSDKFPAAEIEKKA